MGTEAAPVCEVEAVAGLRAGGPQLVTGTAPAQISSCQPVTA